MKERYSMRVRRGAEVIGEYVFRATPAGLQSVIDNMRPEFQFDILSADGIIFNKGY